MFSTRVLKESALWGLLFAALFTFGWWRGHHPEWSLRSLLPSSGTVVVLTPDASWIPSDFVQNLFEANDLQVEVQVIEDFTDFEAKLVLADAPPLVWIPVSWAKGLSAQKLLYSLGDDFSERVHADFRQEGPELFYLPVLWAVDGTDLRIEGLAIPANSPNKIQALRVLRRWTDAQFAKDQTLRTPAASALDFSVMEDLPREKKASSLRDRALTDLHKNR